MLRRYSIAHFALQHSPEKEQRLLFADPRNDHGNGIGGMESTETPETEDHVRDNDPVNVIRNRIEGRVRSVDPKLLISELAQNGNATLKILDGANALEGEREELKIGNPAAKPEQASDAVTALFNDNLPLERILSTVGAIRQKVDEYESRTSEVEHNIRRSFGFEADTNELNDMLGRFSDYENKNNGVGIVESINNKLINEDNICGILKIRGSHSVENRRSFVGILENMARANRLRRAFGQDSEPKDDKARAEARNKFLNELNAAADTIAEYLDARINQRATALLEKSTALSKRFYVDDALSRYGITKDGIGDAFDDNHMSLSHIRRDIADGRKPIKNDRNLTEAEGAINRMNVIEKDMTMKQSDGSESLPLFLLEKRAEEVNAIEWTKKTANRLAALNIPELVTRSPAAEERMNQLVEMVRPFANGNTPTTEDIVDMRQTTVSEQRDITEFIRNIEQNPYALDLELLEQADMEIPEDRIDAVIAETKQRIETIVPDILSSIDHPTARALDLAGGIRKMQERIAGTLESAKESRNGRWLAKASLEAKRLELCKQNLDLLLGGNKTEILEENEYRHVTKISEGEPLSLGFYSYETRHISINKGALSKSQNPDALKKTIVRHELGHAIVDTFRSSGVFPNILNRVHEGLKNEKTEDGTSFDTLLARRAKTWGIGVKNDNDLTYEERWKLMDELVNRYALWKENSGTQRVDQDERKLYSLFEKRKESQVEMPAELTGGVHLTPEEEEQQRLAAEAAAEGGASDEGAHKPSEETLFTKLEKSILDIDAFLKSYSEYGDLLEKKFGYQKIKKDVEEERVKFLANQTENREALLAMLKNAKSTTEKIEKFIGTIDRDRIDLTYESKTGNRSMWQIIVTDTTWVSFYDVVAMFKDAGGDIARMWKRRGESARKKLGRDITDRIPDIVPYLGRLKHEFERSERDSEQEEVGVWEKGLEKIDTHVLQHTMLPKVSSKEQLKAIINVLSKKGRLDWDDPHLWDKLESYSGYRMPRTACRRDTRLRNQWLQKMIADIWRDRDLYERWKGENDGGIKHGREHLNNYISDLSATSSLGIELTKLLFNWNKQVKGLPLSKEEEVNPHLYEGIIYYAMKNGKMSMEEKFFFLVKGVEIGLISVERLRAFSGEEFGILNSFPFIDFFSTGQNCTMHEIRNISRTITETEDRFKPGVKMTKFLYEVVAFDESVQKRVGKGLKNVQNIDHEDVPMYITQLEYAGIDNMITFQSGSQWRLSPAALQNGYVGYNSFMKYFALKAKIGKPPITERDILKLATTLGGYAMWDNKITRDSIGSIAGDARDPKLTWTEIEEQSPVSGRGVMTSEFRNGMNNFTVDLCSKLGLDKVDNTFEIRDFIGVDRNSASPRELLRKYATDPAKDTTDAIYIRMKGATKTFVEELRKKMIADMPAVTEYLASYADNNKLIPESDEFTLEKAREFWLDKAPDTEEAHH